MYTTTLVAKNTLYSLFINLYEIPNNIKYINILKLTVKNEVEIIFFFSSSFSLTSIRYLKIACSI